MRQLVFLLPAKAVRGIPLYDGDQLLEFGIAIDSQHILTKASLLPQEKIITIRSGGKKTLELKRVATDKIWDLALLKVKKKIQLSAILWPSSKVNPVKAGDLLVAKDAGTPVFNQNGEFIGMHIARFSRTMGLIIPAAQLKEQSLKMLVGSEEAEVLKQADQSTAR